VLPDQPTTAPSEILKTIHDDLTQNCLCNLSPHYYPNDRLKLHDTLDNFQEQQHVVQAKSDEDLALDYLSDRQKQQHVVHAKTDDGKTRRRTFVLLGFDAIIQQLNFLALMMCLMEDCKNHEMANFQSSTRKRSSQSTTNLPSHRTAALLAPRVPCNLK
jgi:hypothetical protein